MTLTPKLVVGWLVAALVCSPSGTAAAYAQGSGPAPPAGGPHEGIKVHGRWTIEVRNPDGSLASRHEFDNSLMDGGSAFIAGLLGGFYSRVDYWEIWESGTHTTIPEYLGPGEAPIGTLTRVVPRNQFGDPSGTLELHATLRYSQAAQLSAMYANVRGCVDPACTTHRAEQFSYHSLNPGISVAANHILQITVVYSFS